MHYGGGNGGEKAAQFKIGSEEVHLDKYFGLMPLKDSGKVGWDSGENRLARSIER